ncbi:2-aminoadipate transaminase [Lucilia sericata]|uniref:2-aminoadipate transaminase n=1 Tax=Lucilia sericata TaxID=13632 RepID=UPI0018A8602C|nr:2-aminoadipate transaminase [Lucilia sericata]XP_037817663.1 2-aminoadipate transaminase [Lucilia sericata]
MALANEERMLKHLFDGGDWNVYESKILNLGVGAPGTDLLENCSDIFIKATQHRLKYEKESNSSLLFQYGPTSGTYEARSAIAKYFTEMYQSEVKSEDIFITSGATQGLHVILSTLVDFNGYIFVDEVTYMIALDTMKQFPTLNIIPVKLNEDGVDLALLEKLVKGKQFKSQNKEFWGMYYTIPTYHNPTGILFSEQVCEGLIKLARQYDFLITCDDVYNILYYKDNKAPKRLFAYDNIKDKEFKGNVISNGSFSKILGPGVRLGWLEMPKRVKTLVDNSGLAGSGGCLNNYTSGIVASLFELNLGQQHIKRMYDAYKERMLATSEVLSKELPEGCSSLAPRGGYFIWVTLPSDCSAAEFLKVCMAEEKIFFIPGSRFAASTGGASNCFRLSIAFHEKSKLQDAAFRLCKCLKKYLKK